MDATWAVAAHGWPVQCTGVGGKPGCRLAVTNGRQQVRLTAMLTMFRQLVKLCHVTTSKPRLLIAILVDSRVKRWRIGYFTVPPVDARLAEFRSRGTSRVLNVTSRRRIRRLNNWRSAIVRNEP